MRKGARKSDAHENARKAAKAFIEKVIVPARTAPKTDAKERAARAKLAAEERSLAHRELAAGGIDPKRLDKFAQSRAKVRSKLADDRRKQAIKASAAVADRLRDLAPIVLPLEPMQTIIDTVTFIRSFAGQGTVLESNIAPSDNWARYRDSSTDDAFDGTGRLSFFTLWRNQLSVPAVVTAQASLTINAHLSCDADWSGVASWFGLSSSGRGKVGVRTTVWGMDSSVSSIVQQQDVAEVSVDGGFFGDDSSTSIEFDQLLPASGVIVPRETYVLIEVEVTTSWHHSDSGATVTFDAESGSHRVDLPQLLLTVTPTEPLPPVITLSAMVNYATSPAQIQLSWSGATGANVDVFRNGVLFTTTLNDGFAIVTANPGTYVFRICNSGSTTGCSNDVTVVVTQ